MDDESPLRALPAVGRMLERPALDALAARHGRAMVVRAVREAVAAARAELLGTPTQGAVGIAAESAPDLEAIAASIERAAVARTEAMSRGTLRPVVNATGIVVHTNLGRSPLARSAIDAMVAVAEGYASLEIDLDTGARGDRHGHVVDGLVELTGAEDALVVNNNAAAVLLVVTALAAGRDVVVSRGELVEIGGGFRVPDVITACGAALVEVGTTNRTHLADYERAIGPRTGCLLKVHRSNFTMHGFTSEVSLADLAPLARERTLPLVHDAGSGVTAFLAAVTGEPSVADDVRAGADLVTFSGDKLLGGPQAGIVVGRRALVSRLRRHPLLRALRADKTTIAALAATVDLWRSTPEQVPVARIVGASVTELQSRAERIASRMPEDAAVDVVETVARVGGGAAPDRELASRALRVRGRRDVDALARALRLGDPSIVARIEDDAVLLDLRCVPQAFDDILLAALARALQALP